MTARQLILVCVAAHILIVWNPGYFNADEIEVLERVRGVSTLGSLPITGFLGGESLFYRPLGYNCFLLSQWLVGTTPELVHLLSALTHLLSTWLLMLLCRPWTGAQGARWVAAFFCLSPLSVHAIAWMAAIYDRQALVFILLALLAFRRHLDQETGTLPLLIVVVCQALGLMCKEVAIVLPGLLVLEAYTQGKLRKAMPVIVMLAVGMLLFIGWRLAAQPPVDPSSGYALTVGHNILLNVATYFSYPFSFVLRVGWPELEKLGPSILGFALGCALVGLVFRVLGWRRTCVILAATALPMLPVLMLTKAEGQYLYVSSAFIACGFGWAVYEAAKHGPLDYWGTRILAALFMLHGLAVEVHYCVDGFMTRTTMDTLRPLIAQSTRQEPIRLRLHPETGSRFWVAGRLLTNLRSLEGRKIEVSIEGYRQPTGVSLWHLTGESPWHLILSATGAVSDK